MKKINKTRLHLATETLKNLTIDDLAMIRGGTDKLNKTSDGCPKQEGALPK